MRARLRRLARLLLVALCCAGVGALGYAMSVEAPYSPSGFMTPNEVYDLPRLVAHKAGGAGVVGNTFEAVQRLLETDIAAFEIDIRLSKDRVPMVLHEERLDGYTTGHGLVGEKTADELRQLRLRANGADTPYAIPRLEDVIALVGRSKVVFLDTKDASVRDSGMAAALAGLIRKHDVHPTVIVESFNPVFLWRMRRTDPRVRVMLDFADETRATAEENQEQLAQIPWLLKQEPVRRAARRLVRPDLLAPRFSVAHARLRTLADYGYPLVAWTVDDPELAAGLLESGVSAVMTNQPLALAEALQGRAERAIDDASRLNRTAVAQLVEVRSEDDARRAILAARASGRKLSIAGRRHSMGGQSLGPGHVVLDMTRFRAMSLDDATGILTVGAGASWSDVQRFLDARGRAVLVMQSDNVFSVGGTLSVNAHGWQPRRPPIASTVQSFRLMLASGEVKSCSREENAELFKGALGGYGLLGVILDARLLTTPNVLYRRSASFLPSAEYARRFHERVAVNASAGLAYGRLSVDNANLLTQSALYVYEPVRPAPPRLPAMSDEGLVDLKREIFRASERSDGGKRRRWLLETRLGPLLEAPATRNSVMNSDIHFLWPTDLSRRDILHEYFVPHARFSDFLDALRDALRKNGQDLLNVTVRDLRKDEDGLLAYAREDVFAFVLLFSQRPSADAEARMQLFTRDLVERTLALGGTFYLPYRLHYTPAQFRRAYPMAPEFLELKRRVDPDELFSSRFYQHVRAAVPEAQADRPTPRTDENSKIAHAELLQKAKQGKIDVYFEGDSITRRWGASDEKYKELLANWKQNFFGWNAGNFGWGADSIQNILWRLENGELDGVKPKVVVVMAGTNNVAKPVPPGEPDTRVKDIVRGLEAIVDICRRKAPGATIVLMGITPRNDDMKLMPVIDEINRELGRLGDGKKLRFLNINDKLADRDGKLLPGMTGPDMLHLAVPGYQVWADALKPILRERLGKPASVDRAPPPTGDPSARRKP